VILADTSVWVDHLRSTDLAFATLLQREVVLMHPFVIGEIAVGNLASRKRTLAGLKTMIQAVTATDDEALNLIEEQRLFGLGIGYVDMHLLASVRLTPGTSLWTRDKRLHAVAQRLGMAAAI
jgi:predicted nucleic acid-binding protein